MSEPLPPLPEPFAPEPRPLRGPGCGRGALIGCGALILLVGIAGVGLTLNANRMLLWILQRLETKIETKLPADLTTAERQRFSAAFGDLYGAVGEGKVQPAAVQSLQRELFAISGDVDRGLTREQVLSLTEAIEEAAGDPAKPAASPAPAPGLIAPPA